MTKFIVGLIALIVLAAGADILHPLLGYLVIQASPLVVVPAAGLIGFALYGVVLYFLYKE